MFYVLHPERRFEYQLPESALVELARIDLILYITKVFRNNDSKEELKLPPEIKAKNGEIIRKDAKIDRRLIYLAFANSSNICLSPTRFSILFYILHNGSTLIFLEKLTPG